MTVAQLIPLAINLSMGLIVLALGLNASFAEALSLFRRPGLLIRSLLSMNVVMTAVAVAMAFAFDLHPAVKIALVALALSPVPPILPGKQTKAGGTHSYVVGLLAAISVIAIVVAPAGFFLVDRLAGGIATVQVSSIASVVFISVIVPLALGMLIRAVAPDLAERLARPLSLFATALLIVAFVPVLIGIWPALVDIVGNGTLAALIVFTLVGVAVGHYLGGPDPDDRTVLALATATRHPGVAIAIAHATFPDEKAVIAVVLWHLLLGAVVCIPYVNWRKRVHEAAAPTPRRPG